MKREPRYYEVSRKQIFLFIFIASLALTAVFNIGIYIGKRRVINAELKEEQQKIDNILSEIESINYSINYNHDTEEQIEKKPKTEDLSEKKKTNSELQKGIDIKDKAKISAEEKSFNETKKYTVKVATFTRQENAENLLNLIKTFGYESWIISDLDKKTFHVIIGKFNSRDLAESFGKELKNKHEFINGYIIREFKD